MEMSQAYRAEPMRPLLEKAIEETTLKYMGVALSGKFSSYGLNGALTDGIEGLVKDDNAKTPTLKEAKGTFDQTYILKNLEEANYLKDGTISGAAKLSGYSREAFTRKTHDLGIPLADFKQGKKGDQDSLKYFKKETIEALLRDMISSTFNDRKGVFKLLEGSLSNMADELTDNLNAIDIQSLYLDNRSRPYNIGSGVLREMYKAENLGKPKAYEAFKEEFEKRYIGSVLDKYNHNLNEAAKELDMTVRNLRRKVKRHNISKKDFNEEFLSNAA
jgi:hypothetical protein